MRSSCRLVAWSPRRPDRGVNVLIQGIRLRVRALIRIVVRVLHLGLHCVVHLFNRGIIDQPFGLEPVAPDDDWVTLAVGLDLLLVR